MTIFGSTRAHRKFKKSVSVPCVVGLPTIAKHVDNRRVNSAPTKHLGGWGGVIIVVGSKVDCR